MCAPSPGGSHTLGIIVSSPLAVIVGSGSILALWAGGATLLACGMMALTFYSAIITILYLVKLQNAPAPEAPKPFVPPTPQPPRTPVRVLSMRTVAPAAIETARPQLEAAPRAAAPKRARWNWN